MNIKMVHILSVPDAHREKMSVACLQATKMNYMQIINPLYEGPFPPTTHIAPDVNSRCYGCFSSHKNAIEQEFSKDLDALLVCECDCMIGVKSDQFQPLVESLIKQSEECHLACLSIGGFCVPPTKVIKDIYIVEEMKCTQSVLYMKEHRDRVLSDLQKDWLPFDIFLSRMLGKDMLLGVTSKRYTSQYTGLSTIDGHLKRFNNDRIDPVGYENSCFYQ